MSHNNTDNIDLNSNGIPKSKRQPIRPPSIKTKSVSDLLIKETPSQEQQGVAFPNDKGIKETPIEPPVVLESLKSPYHNGGRGRPSIKHIIFTTLNNYDKLTASDISAKVNLSTRIVASKCRQMVLDGNLKSQKPNRHLGERFATLYWVINNVQ